jgi:DNA polymerase-3 subunit epsilon
MYAIVDIETTGGNASQGSITEVAILITDGIEVLHRYTTLVNPKRPIPVFIEKLTGITDEMVSSAPVFAEVAAEIHGLLCDKIFVAHNVNFDYSFLSHQLQQHGYRLQSRKLCTVRLSRKIFENQPSYSLGNLCRSLGIPVTNRHRAMGDAEATTELFIRLLSNDTGKHVEGMLKKGSREGFLPMHLSGEDLEKMPDSPGIYYFHDNKGKVIYVGKAKKLKKRVISHFSNNDVSKRKQDLIRLVNRISFLECGNELMMSVMESIEIKRIWPQFNRSQKKFEHRFGICSYEDRKGILRLGIVAKKKQIQTHITFPIINQGRILLNRLAKEHSLCPKMCFLQEEHIPCTGREAEFCEGICEQSEEISNYNQKVQAAIRTLEKEQPTLAVFGPGRKMHELSCILVGRNDLLATGFVTHHAMKMKKEKLLKQLEPAASNEYIRSMVTDYAANNPALAVLFD